MTESCTWTDRLIELQLWTRLSAYARFVHDHAISLKCTGKALEFACQSVMVVQKSTRGSTRPEESPA